MASDENLFSTDQAEKTCLNCDTPVSHTYCSNCGQMYETHEISVKSLLKSWFKRQRHHVEVFVFTTRHLITDPGTVVRDYWEGKKKRYYNPFNYFLLAGSVMTFVVLQYGNFDPEIANQVNIDRYAEMGIEVPAEASQTTGAPLHWIQGHWNIVLMGMIPIYAFSLWLIFRKRRKRNYGQILILSLFAVAMYLLFSFPLIPLIDYNDPTNSPWYFVSVASMILMVSWVVGNTFRLSWWRSILSIVGMYVLTLLFIIMIGLVGGILVGIIGGLIKGAMA